MASPRIMVSLVGLLLAGTSAVQESQPTLESFVIRDLVPDSHFALSAPISTRVQILGNPTPEHRDVVLYSTKGAGFTLQIALKIPQIGVAVLSMEGEIAGIPFAKIVGGEEVNFQLLDGWYGAEHVFTGQTNPVHLGSYTFKSDPQYPLVFKVERVLGKGYYYVCGRGTVTKKGEKPIRLG